jgi:hypothetical protein
MNEITTIARPANALVPANITDAMHLAEFMSRARTVPKHLQDSPGDCLMVIEQAMRWGMSPFAVAQATSVISGKLMYEGKLVAAAVESSGAIVGLIAYDFSGEGDGRTITVTATRRGETNPRTVTVAFKDARTNNEMWKRQPDQQLVYHGARVWARRWTPAVILGVYSREEMGVIIDGESEDTTPPSRDARDAMNADIPLKAAATGTGMRGARIEDRAKSYGDSIDLSPLLEDHGPTWLKNLETLLMVTATDQEEILAIGGHFRVSNTLADKQAPADVKRRVTELLANGYKRFAEPADDDTEAHEPATEDVA